ncbi:DUF6377 domain-containing protein [Pedobacter suwonensis]|uniref:DUF6377 domain-containing protein n=1 Tax=Pedobacter suwonensis TaxID=332999 RepID=UPI0036BBB62E
MEKKSFCVCLLILFIAQTSFARQDDDSTLDFLIRNKGIYTQVKEQEISRIKHKKNTSLSKKQLYEINKQLYYEYKTFISDSAIFYAVENLRIAESLNDEKAKLETKLILAATYSVAGMFFEGLDLLKSINPKKLQPDLLVSYYDTYKLLYGYYSQNNIHTSSYLEKSASYRDSLLQVLDPQSTHYKIVFSEKLFDSNRLAEAKDILIALLNDTKEESHLKAVLAYALANIYKKEGNIEMQKKYYTISAISDIKNNIKENASLQALATVLYNTGDIERAYQCIKSSMEDAIFCNAHLRTFEISRIFPIIDKAYQDKALKQKNELKTFLILISILSFFLILAVVYVYGQMKKVSRIRAKLHNSNLMLNEVNGNIQETNDKLKVVNNQLSIVNSELTEANQIKEFYIGHFLDLCSTYINKLQKFQSSLNRKLMENKKEELFKMLRSNEMINNEVKELYDHFDHIFLHLYPNFIDDFNSLLLEEERFTLKPNELLNVELRIFALIRLGITDSSKISNFLHYSTNTIYSYRTRIRNKAAVPRQEFESMVMKIGSISL